MSLVTTSELATHMRRDSAPSGAQALIDTAEDLLAAYIGISLPSSGRNPLLERSIVERIIPRIDRTFLEVSGGPISSIQTIYTVSGTTITPVGVNPFFSGWSVGARSSTGVVYTFERNREYVVEYHTGWSTGTRTLYDFSNATPETPGAFDLLSWTTEDDDGAAQSNLTQGSATRMRWTQTERFEALVSPDISIAGSSYPFISMRLGLTNTPTLADWEIVVDWKASGENDYFGEERSMRFSPPYRVTAEAADPLSIFQLDMTGDSEGKPFEELQGLTQPIEPVRRWIDDTVTSIRIRLWAEIPSATSISAETLPVIDIDWISLSDGSSTVLPSIKRAILMTAASLDGADPGILAQRIGDYSVQFDPSEAISILPAGARRIVHPFKRASW